jgi:hypothetical protein
MAGFGCRPRVVDGSCLATYEVVFKNIGKVTLKINRAEIKVFIVTPPKLEQGLQVLDPTQLVDKPLLTRNLKTKEALGDNFAYGPDEGTYSGTVVHVKRAPGRIVLFQLEMELERELPWFWWLWPPNYCSTKTKEWDDHRWEYACEMRRDDAKPDGTVSKSPVLGEAR